MAQLSLPSTSMGTSIKGRAGSRETRWQRKPSVLKRIWVELKLEFLLPVKTTKPSSIRIRRKHNLGWVPMQHDLLPPRSIRVSMGKTVGKLTCFWSSCTALQLGSFTKNWCLGAVCNTWLSPCVLRTFYYFLQWELDSIKYIYIFLPKYFCWVFTSHFFNHPTNTVVLPMFTLSSCYLLLHKKMSCS